MAPLIVILIVIPPPWEMALVFIGLRVVVNVLREENSRTRTNSLLHLGILSPVAQMSKYRQEYINKRLYTIDLKGKAAY